MRRLLATLAAFLTALSGHQVAVADTGAEVISYGRTRAPGVAAEVMAVATSRSAVKAAAPGGQGAPTGGGGVSVPAPVALSAHNCIPRTDARGVSLSYVFSESGVGDCVTFVSPPPGEARPPRPDRRPRPSPESLAQAAFQRVIELAPRPALDVAPGRVGLTGLPSYFWVRNDLAPVTANASAGGLTVTATAQPSEYVWAFGDGTDRTTRHPGRAWTKRKPGNVGHLYETKGRYEPEVTVVWVARWRINRGPWQPLGYFSTTGSVDYRVREVRAVLVR